MRPFRAIVPGIIGGLVLILFFVFNISSIRAEKKDIQPYPEFGDFWYKGKAELTRYDLHQARYGEIHRGDAVLIFVTEDFLPDKQVKYEYRQKTENIAKVLKLNFTRKFNTGIYPYSIMSSIFSPLNTAEHALKISSSSQEWCGHTYMQLNNRDDQFHFQLHSYFEAEADQQLTLDQAWLEDELWTQIRINPQALPIGDIELIPSLQYLRLRHLPAKIVRAKASLTNDVSGNTYTVTYKEIDRTISINFENKPPFIITGWKETYTSGFGDKAKLMTTTASRTNEVWLDYWAKHDVADSTWRAKLGLK